MRRENTKNKWKRCQKYGHNTRTCEEQPQGVASKVSNVGSQVPTKA